MHPPREPPRPAVADHGAVDERPAEPALADRTAAGSDSASVAQRHGRAEGRTARMLQAVPRWIWLSLAIGSLAIGLIGVLLPGLPTTPFVLLAAWAAARGSDRLHRRLRTHRMFGPLIADWEHSGAVSRRAKRAALASMLACVLLLLAVAPHWGWAAGAGACMAVVAAWLWRRPER